MFAKLKKKIQEEAQNTVGIPEEKKPGSKATSPGPGLASPVNKDYPAEESPFSTSRGPIFGHVRKDSDASSKMGSRTSSVDDIAKESSSSKEEVLAMLMKRTEQVKKLESKISELAAMIKDKNRRIDKLESNMEKQQEIASQKLEEMTEKYQTEKTKVTEGFKAAVGAREEELRLGVKKEMEELKKNKVDLEVRLQEAQKYRQKLYAKEEESEELHGLSSQEIAKVKHMFLMSQDELKQATENLTASKKKVHNLENEIHSLMTQIATLTSKCEETEETNKSLTRSLDDTHLAREDVVSRLKEKNTELEQVQKLYSDLQSSLQTIKRDSESNRQQFHKESDEKSEQISHLKERVNTLEQRLQDGELSGDERVKALESERDSLEKKLCDSREHLKDIRSTSTQKVGLLERQVDDLQQKVKVGECDLEMAQKELQDVRNNLSKEVDSWKSKLQMALREVKDKERLLDSVKESQEAEAIRQQKNSSMLEEGFWDQLRQLKSQLDSAERARERERVSAQDKITRLESGQEDWLEREIDSERQITRLEEDLQKTKIELSKKKKVPTATLR